MNRPQEGSERDDSRRILSWQVQEASKAVSWQCGREEAERVQSGGGPADLELHDVGVQRALAVVQQLAGDDALAGAAPSL